jgi:hypothetical protein
VFLVNSAVLPLLRQDRISIRCHDARSREKKAVPCVHATIKTTIKKLRLDNRRDLPARFAPDAFPICHERKKKKRKQSIAER